MTRKAILGISFAVLFAVTMITYQSFATASNGDAPGIANSNVSISDKKLNAVIHTDGEIPTDGSAGAFGYGILTAGTNNVLAVTTHLCAADSPVQGDAACPDGTVGLLNALTGLPDTEHDDATWHPHILDLKESDGYCKRIGAPLEVDLASTVESGNNVSPSDYQLVIDDNTIQVQAPLGGGDVIPDGSGVAVVSFDIAADAKKGVITDLCVLNVAQ